MQVLYPGRTGIWSGGEPKEKPSEQGMNQQQTQPTFSTMPESNLGHIGGWQALSPLCHPCSPEKGAFFKKVCPIR